MRARDWRIDAIVGSTELFVDRSLMMFVRVDVLSACFFIIPEIGVSSEFAIVLVGVGFVRISVLSGVDGGSVMGTSWLSARLSFSKSEFLKTSTSSSVVV